MLHVKIKFRRNFFLPWLILKNQLRLKNFHSNLILTCKKDVVVQFYPWFKFYFPLLWGVVMYDNESKAQENKI